MTLSPSYEPRGATLLDALFPNWELIIDQERLDITSESNCVLGQLFGSYTKGRKMLGLSEKRAEDEGFYISTNVWRMAVERRMPAYA